MVREQMHALHKLVMPLFAGRLNVHRLHRKRTSSTSLIGIAQNLYMLC